jgi:hypothetical protein
MPLRGCVCPDVRIFFATNRLWDPDGNTFGDAHSYEEFTYGECLVRGIEVTAITPYSSSEVACNNVSRYKLVFVFLHGFNNTFKTSAVRLAAFAQQMGVVTRTTNEIAFVLISWPSKGKATAYWDDEALSRKSSPLIGDLLRRMQTRAPGRIHIIAHSLGVRTLWRAMKFLPRPATEDKRFGHIFWIAGDMGRIKFCHDFDRSYCIQDKCRTSTSYYCHQDGALTWSWANSMFIKRLGHSCSLLKARYLNDQVHYSIKVDSEIALEGDPMYAHTYFTAKPMVEDIFKRAINDETPSRRGLRPRTGRGWALQPPICADCDNIVPLFKLFNTTTKTPMVVASIKELKVATKKLHHRYAGVACRLGHKARAPFDLPLYDIYYRKDDVHTYTTNEQERAELLSIPGMSDKGPVGFLCRKPVACEKARLVPILRIKFKSGGTVHVIVDSTQAGVSHSMLADKMDGCTTTSIIGYAVPPY